MPLKMGLVGLGRMGSVHARNIASLENCELVAIVDEDPARFAGAPDVNAKRFTSIEEYAASGICNATMLVSPTDFHRQHAGILLKAGHRVLMEKPLTGTLDGDRQFAKELDRDYPNGIMIAFQRRYDGALAYAKQLASEGAIGRVFKIYSALEDSGPPPDGYRSGGILPDMSIHNVDEILWLMGDTPEAALAVGSNVYGHRVSTCEEDFDDAMLYMWFSDCRTAQVQVTRNHVSGYRVESVLYGEKGHIQVGHFFGNTEEITVQAFGKRFSKEPIAQKTFPGGEDLPGIPEFVSRFGSAYRAEVKAFADCCLAGSPFPITHNDALRAQVVISTGMQKMLTREDAGRVNP